MNRRQLIVAAGVAGLWLAGCDRPKEAAVPSAPTTQPSTVVALAPVIPSTSQPAVAAPAAAVIHPAVTTSSFVIYENGQPILYEFPKARIHIDASNNTAVLYSDDPKTAINPDYAGNSFYLAVPLDKDRPAKLDNVQWDYRCDSGGEHQQAADGFFLSGQRYHLQPADIHVELRGEAPKASFRIIGAFVKFDTARAGGSHLGYDVRLQSPAMNSGWQPASVDAAK